MAPLPSNIASDTLETGRLKTHYLSAGDPAGDPVVLLHGNVSSAPFWDQLITALPEDRYLLAPDLRGYGKTTASGVDATRGLGQFSDDLGAFLDVVGVENPVLVGWSLGGGVAMEFLRSRATDVAGLVLINPISPYGFGGTHLDGEPCQPDHAGTGAGLTNDDFVARLERGDLGSDSDASPRSVLRQFYIGPETELEDEREDRYVAAMVSMAIGEEHYPGDVAPSTHWPGAAPGTNGVNNAISPKYFDCSDIVEVERKPPIHWLRGRVDTIVSDESFFDAGTLGKLGELPDWPGIDEFPPQPMVSQTRAVLQAYEAAGGRMRESVFDDLGHSPHIERPKAVASEIVDGPAW